MGFALIVLALILETCPMKEYNWDFGAWWSVLIIILFVQIAVSVTTAQNTGRRG